LRPFFNITKSGAGSIAARSVEEVCVLALAFKRKAGMQMLEMSAGQIRPIDPSLGPEAREWSTRPKRN
jgi:L-fuculose-phosphate aldolase